MPLSFEVTVLRADGTPAPGADVWLENTDWPFDDGTLGRAKADASGVARMRVPHGVARVVAWLGAEGGAQRDLLSLDDVRTTTVRLGPAVAVRGRVVLRGGAVAGAQVGVTIDPWAGTGRYLMFRTTSAADGRFETPPIALSGIDPASPPYVVARTADCAKGDIETNLESLHDGREVVVELVAGFTVRGRFIDTDGKALEHAVVRVSGRTESAEADAQGAVTMRLPREEAHLVVLVPTGKTAGEPRIRSKAVDPAIWWTARALGAYDGSSDVELGTVVVKRGRPLAGVVVDSDGSPSQGAFLRLLLDGEVVGDTYAAKDGRFEFAEVGAEPHRLDVEERGPDGVAGRHLSVEGVRVGTPELRVALAPSLVVTLKFLFADGDKPVFLSDVVVKGRRHGDDADCVDEHWTGESTDSFAFEAPSAGTFDLDVAVAGYAPLKLLGIEVVAGRPSTLELQLQKTRD
jgi:hypothetical protein